MNKVYLGNLPFKATEDAIADHLGKVATPTKVELITDRETGRAKGFGFATFETAQEADAVVARLHNQDFDGRALTVQPAQPREERGRGRR